MRSQALLRGLSEHAQSRRRGVCWAGFGALRGRFPGSVEPGARTLINCAVRAFRERHLAAPPRPGSGRVALEPRVSVAEAVSSLTFEDAFVAACARPALPTRFICSFPDCGASYNKAWKLDAHLCKHTGEVTWPRMRVASPAWGLRPSLGLG